MSNLQPEKQMNFQFHLEFLVSKFEYLFKSTHARKVSMGIIKEICIDRLTYKSLSYKSPPFPCPKLRKWFFLDSYSELLNVMKMIFATLKYFPANVCKVINNDTRTALFQSLYYYLAWICICPLIDVLVLFIVPILHQSSIYRPLLWYSEIFEGYRKRTFALNWLICTRYRTVPPAKLVNILQVSIILRLISRASCLGVSL